MESNSERSSVPVDARIVDDEDHAQESNVAAVLNSGTVKIDSLCINLGIVKDKGDAQKCSHFSIRAYVAKMIEKGGSHFLPFDGRGEQKPPIEVPRFRYWRCQSCLRDCGAASTSQEIALVCQFGQSVVQPCATSCPLQDCDGVAILPFGEGTSGLKPVDKRNDYESILTALRGDESQRSPEIRADTTVPEEPTKVGSVDNNATAEANAGAPGSEEGNDLRNCEDPKQARLVVHSDQPDHDPSGHQRRKARKVRLLAELLCGNTEDPQQKKEINPLDLGPIASSSPLTSSSQIKRKMSQDQDQSSVDVNGPGYVGKKVKTFKRDATAKNGMVKHSGDSGACEGGLSTDKHQGKKHGTQRISILGKVNSDPMMAWQSVPSNTERAGKPVSAANGASSPSQDVFRGRVTEPYFNLMLPPQPDKKCNAYKKISKDPLRSQVFEEDLQRRTNVGGSRVRDRQSDMESVLGLSLSYDPQAQVCSLPSILNRIPSQDHSRKAGFVTGESSIAHRVPSDPKSNEGSVCEVSNRHAPRTEFLQEQRHYAQLSHGSFSQHQKLVCPLLFEDFSDPYNTRISGVRGYSDLMRACDHQRQEKMFSIGRSDEREIAELMAKIQHERSLSEASSYCLPGGANINWIPNTSGFLKVNLNEGMSTPHQEYPSTWRSSSSISTSENVGPTTMRNPAGYFHQERVPGFSMFDASSQYQKQQSNGIQISDSGAQRHHNSRYHYESKGKNKIAHRSAPTNMQVSKAFSKYHNGTPQNEATRNVGSTVPSSMSFGQTHAICSHNNKGKSIIDLDLNVVAPNVLEEQNDFESLNRISTEYHNSLTKDKRMVLNPKHMGGLLDSSYSNDAIPAMQLLSLMDAGKSSLPISMDGTTFIAKPFSPCYNHSSSMTGKPNSLENSLISYSRLRPGVQQPTECSRHFLSAPGSSPSLALPNSFSSMLRTDQNENGPSSHGHQVYHQPRQENPRGSSSASMSHGCRPEDSLVFPLSWHATEDHSGRVNLGAQGTFGSRNGLSGTEVCTINQNPADFSTPGPENVYMINVEDLIIRGESSYKGKPSSVNRVGRKKHKRERILKQPRLQWQEE